MDLILRVISGNLFIPMLGLAMMVYYRRSSLGRRNGNGLISQLIGKNDSVLELALGLGL